MKKLIVMHIIGNNEKQIYECEDKNLIKQLLDIEDYFGKLDFIDDKIMITKYFKSTENTTIYEDLQNRRISRFIRNDFISIITNP